MPVVPPPLLNGWFGGVYSLFPESFADGLDGETIFVIRRGDAPYRLLRSLYFLRALGTTQIHRMFYPEMDANRVRKQLKLMERHGFLEKAGRLYAGIDPKAKGKGQSVWLLGRRGYRFLESAEGLSSVSVTSAWIRPLGRKGKHVLGLNDIYLRLAGQDVKPFEWVTYPKGHVYYRVGADGFFGAGKVYPDAVVSWQEDGGTRRLFLEYDRGTEPLGRIRGKIEQLRDSLLKQVPDSKVVFACEGWTRAGNIGYSIRERCLEDRMMVCMAEQAPLLIASLIGEKDKKDEPGEASWLGMLSGRP